MAQRKKKSKTSKVVNRLFRFLFAIVILSALVLGVSLIVKEMYATDTGRFAQLIKPLLVKLHIPVSEEQIGNVAGEFVSRIAQTNLASGVESDRSDLDKDSTSGKANTDEDPKSDSGEKLELLAKVAILSDIHDDLAGLEGALYKIQSENVDFIIVLGDLTGFGDLESLQLIKDSLDNSGYIYYTLPGDHDLAESVGLGNYKEVFGDTRQLVEQNDIRFLIMDNSANFTEVPAPDMSWFKDNVNTADFVILSQPLFTDDLLGFFVRMYMGSTRDPVEDSDMIERQGRVLEQRNELLKLVRDSEVLAVIAGDHHKSSEISDSERASLSHFVVGAITGTVNEYPQSVIQDPRYSILSVYSDKSFQLEDVILD